MAIKTPPEVDPFATAATVHLQAIANGDVVAQTTATVSMGHFSLDVDLPLPSMSLPDLYITVDALAAGGTVVGHGQSPHFGVQASDSTITVWVGVPGHFGTAPAQLTRARANVAADVLPQIGALIAGGSVGNAPVDDVDVYNDFQHQAFAVTALPAPRVGGFLVGYSRGLSVGAANLVCGGTPAPTADAIDFDPVSAQAADGQWNIVASDPSLARLFPSTSPLTTGGLLVAGGLDGMGNPLATATIYTAGQAPSATATVAPMGAARKGQVAVAGTFGGEVGVLLFGGLPPGSTGPVAEEYETATARFGAVPQLAALPSRTGATATVLPDGRVLIAGGADPSGTAQASGIVIASDLTPTVLPALLPGPRAHQVMFVDGSELILCGGVDAQGATIADCVALDAKALTMTRTFPLAVGRADAQVVKLETGDLLLVGGTTAGGVGTQILEIYTPHG